MVSPSSLKVVYINLHHSETVTEDFMDNEVINSASMYKLKSSTWIDPFPKNIKEKSSRKLFNTNYAKKY